MKKRKGFIIITALVISAALSLMVGAFSLSVMLKNQVAMHYVNSVKAYHLASSGAQFFDFYMLYNTPSNVSNTFADPSDVSGDFSIPATGTTDDVKVRYSYTKDDQRLKCDSFVTVNGASRRLYCDLDASKVIREIVFYYGWYYSRKLPVLKWTG